ncbi:MAG: sigma-70 family RNA polymerase sigma factor [Verrucomicrobia bacterium]|nr:sigma-70 family RNA polymerase sigma factor [Verrucomicrobiota bacterium]
MNVGRLDGAASDVSSGLFADTHWSLVMRAKDDSATALNSLGLAYRAALVVWLRCRGAKPEDAEDLVQGLFEHLLSYEFLRNVARQKGRFRTFLLAAFQNYLCDQLKRAGAAKRGSGQIPQSLEETDGEGRPLHTPASASPSPDQEYDRAWAAAILASALQRLSAECARTGHAALYTALEPALFADDDAPAYAQIGQRLGLTEGAVRMAALRIRQRLKGLIRDEVRQTVASEGELEEELHYLLSLFGRAGPGP